MDEALLRALEKRIRVIGEAARDLAQMGSVDGIPAVERNAARILACVKMLEIDIMDPAALLFPSNAREP